MMIFMVQKSQWGGSIAVEKSEKAEPNISALVTRLESLLNGECHSMDDAAMFYAPSECLVDISVAVTLKCAVAMLEAGFTPEEFQDELESRVGDRWVWASGMVEASERVARAIRPATPEEIRFKIAKEACSGSA